jgi:hypothetical protein
MRSLLTVAVSSLLLAAVAMPASADPLEGYAPVDLTDYTPIEGASALLLLQDIIEGHPEALEGKPVMTVDLRKSEDGQSIIIDVEKTGFLDDSVDGERYRAIVVPGTSQAWKLERLGLKLKCGRGESAGVWTTGNCP